MDIVRMNYFKGEFLTAEDFQKEQDYHRTMRLRHNKDLHNTGIVKGLTVTLNGIGNGVNISPGVAINPNGQEIVLEAAVPDHPITAPTYVAIKQKIIDSPLVTEKDGFSGTKYKTESHEVILKGDDPDAVVLAYVKSVGPVTLDSTFKPKMASAVSNGDLAVGGNLTVSGTVDGRDVSADGTRLDNHVGTTAGNPHGTTAALIDSQGGTNKIVAQINAGTGIISDARIDTAVARNTKFDLTTGHDHDGVDSKKLTGINSTHFTNLSGANLIGLNGSQITTGTVDDLRIDSAIARLNDVIALLPILRSKKSTSEYPTTSTVFVDMDLSLTFTTNRDAMLMCIFNASGAGNDTAGTRNYWKMFCDATEIGHSMKFSSQAWELGAISIAATCFAAKGTHTVKVQWRVTSGKCYCPHINTAVSDVGMRSLVIVEFPTVYDKVAFDAVNVLSTQTAPVLAIDPSKYTFIRPT